MKIAYVDYLLKEDSHKDQDRLISGLRLRGIEVHFSEDLDQLEKENGSLDSFDGVLIHPGVIMQNYYISKLEERYSQLPFAIVTAIHEDYRGDMSIFGYEQFEKIISFFNKTTPNLKNSL